MRFRFGYSLLACFAALVFLGLSFSACGTEDDDDDDDSWRYDPAIVADGTEGDEGLTETALAAIERAPAWLERDLIVALGNLSEAMQDVYGTLIVDGDDDRFVDEIAFCVAHMSPDDLSHNDFDPELLVANAASIYAADEILDYVRIVDEGGPGKSSDYYSTLEIQLPDGPAVLDREIYYWYVVHPRLEDERPGTIDPATGRRADPPDGVFWRDYLLYHADDDCPGKAECPVLADLLAGETLLWAGLNDAQDNGAVGAITRWVNVSMVFDSGSERPIQPVRIYELHMGRCGEHADLTTAAARAALVPAVNTVAYADDHTWNEFFDGVWHEWEPVNGYIDEFQHYDQWGGGGPGLHGVLNTRGDGYAWSRLADYSGTAAVDVAVKDEDGNPVEGARVTSSALFAGRYVSSAVEWTDAAGTATLAVGDEGQYLHLQVRSPLGDYPEGDPERMNFATEEGQTYSWDVTLAGARDALDVEGTTDDAGAGKYTLTVGFDVQGYLCGTGTTGGLSFCDGPREGGLRVLILDAANHERYDAGEPFEAQGDRIAGTGDLVFDVPRPGAWYVVLSNEECVSSRQVGTVTVSLTGPDGEVTGDTYPLNVAPGDRFRLALTGL